MHKIRRLIDRVAAWTLLVGAVWIVHNMFVLPLLEAHRTLDDARARAQTLLEKYQNEVVSDAELHARLNQLEQQDRELGLYVEGDTEALAAAELQNRVQTQIRYDGGVIKSIQVRPHETDETEDSLVRIAVRVTFHASTAEFQKIVYALEANPSVTFVENLEISGHHGRRRRVEQPVETVLAVRMDVVRYFRPEIG